ncbi:MAG: hypothetical protein A2Z04_03180 [Chloroflexi bacterium RBG_16_57_9]|nr:MAG: hypothetical protein A2Z04_03180 [Chloroflexi bacterium RBG_16_57_9]
MEITLKADLSTFDFEDVRLALSSALHHEATLADARRESYERICREFESRHKLTSDEFMQQFEAGTLGDDADFFDWYAAKRGLDVWDRRFRILAGVSV